MLQFEHAMMPANERLRGHGHAAAHAVVVLQGELAERSGRDEQLIRQNGFRVSQPGAVHDLTFGACGAACLIIEAKGPFWRRIFMRRLRCAESAFGEDAVAAQLAGLGGAGDVLARRESIEALGRLFAIRDERGKPRWFDDAMDLIDRGEVRRLSHVADTLRRDKVHLARAFGAYFGLRPVDYRAMRRAGAAMQLVRSSDAPLAEIAHACGYAHQSHMTRAFRSLFGYAPSHWRA